MFFNTSGNRADTSLPRVIAMIVFCIDSFLQESSVFLQHSPGVLLPFICILGSAHCQYWSGIRPKTIHTQAPPSIRMSRLSWELPTRSASCSWPSCRVALEPQYRCLARDRGVELNALVSQLHRLSGCIFGLGRSVPHGVPTTVS